MFPVMIMADWTRGDITGDVTSRSPISGSITVRVPIGGNVSGGNKQIRELRFLPISEFPEVGRMEVLYVDTSHDKTYYWDGAMYRSLDRPGYEILAKTTAEWNALPGYVSKSGSIYIYTDYSKDDQSRDIPALKIGDGLAYVVDLPFMASVTEADREFWNNKVSAAIHPTDNENLVLYTGHGITIGG